MLEPEIDVISILQLLLSKRPGYTGVGWAVVAGEERRRQVDCWVSWGLITTLSGGSSHRFQLMSHDNHDVTSSGPYSLNNFTSNQEERMEDNAKRMKMFFEIRDFWAKRCASLLLSTFESNQKLAMESCVPSFDDLEWAGTPNGKAFASNLVVTADCFHNLSHVDKDHTKFSFGMFCRIVRETGELYDQEQNPKLGDVHKCTFVIQDYGVKVDFDGCNGTIEMIWDTEVSLYLDLVMKSQ